MKYFLLSILTLISFELQASGLDESLKKIEDATNAQNLGGVITAYEELLANYDDLGGELEKLPVYKIQYAQFLTYAARYNEAINILLGVIEEIEENPRQEEILARCYMQMGMIYFFTEQWDDALYHYHRSENLATKLDLPLGMSIAKINIGNIYQKKFDYDSAIRYYNDCLEIQQSIGDSSTICNAIYNLGTCYEELGDEQKAYSYFERSHRIASNINDSEIRALSLSYLGLLRDNAEQIEEGISIVEASGHRQVLLDAYRALGRLKSQKGQFEEAYDFVHKADILSDTIFKAESIRQLNDFSIKQKEIEREARVTIMQTIFYSVGSALVLGLGLLFLIIQAKIRTNRRLRELNLLKDKFVQVISHDIKNPLQSQRSVLELILSNIDNLNPTQIRELCDNLLNSSRALLELLYNLLNWSQLETKTIRYTPVNVDLSAVVREIMEIYQIPLNQKKIRVEVTIGENTIVHGDYNMISTIIRNILGNAIKFSSSGDTITLIANDCGDKGYKISIADQGAGIPLDVQEKLFKLGANPSKQGTAGESGSGLGLIITKEMLAFNGGRLEVQSVLNQGTTISFTIEKGRA